VWRLWEELSRGFPALAFRGGNCLGVLRNPGGAGDASAYLDELFSSSAENQERIRRYYALCAGRIEFEHSAKPGNAASAESIQALEERLAQVQQAAAKERDRMLAAQAALAQQFAIAKGNVEELTAEIERLAMDQAQSRAETIEARKAYSRLNAIVEQERMLRAMLENSHSWRLTKPLRTLFSLFRRNTRD
jgi:hypothetical protein